MFKGKRIISYFLSLVMIMSVCLPGVSLAQEKRGRSVGQLIKKPEEQKFINDQIIIKIRGNTRLSNEILNKYRLVALRRDNKFGYIVARTPKGADIERLIKRIKKDNSSVQYAQPNYIYRTFGRPNDPLYFRQWALQKTNAEKAWDLTNGKNDVIIAILDTGVDVNHPDLKGKIVPGTNTLNPLKSIRDDDGHGTHVAGIAAAVFNNSAGISGTAGGCRIMPVKVFDYWGGSDLSVADGIVWAADHGAKVINMSFGTWSSSALLGEAIEYAQEKGVVMVAAAGNWASQNISYPAALSQVIAVSATDKDDKLARFSSYGPEIDVSAPGAKILSTYWDQHKGSTYTEMEGTSMAAPHVAGLAALLISAKPWLSPEEVRQIIESSAQDLGDPGWDPKYGHGRIDMYKALTTAFDKVDAFNNSQEEAEKIIEGQRIVRKIDYGADEDWYSISVPEGASLQFELQPAGKVTPALEIYNADGEMMESFNLLEDGSFYDAGLWGFFPDRQSIKVGEAVYGIMGDLADGDYFFRVFGNHNRWSDDYYSLKARILTADEVQIDNKEPNNTIAEARLITLATKVPATINPSLDEDWYKVYLYPEKIYSIQAEVPAGVDLAVEVFPEPTQRESEDRYAEYEEYSIETIDNAGQGGNEAGIFRVYSKTPGYYYLKVYDKFKGAANDAYTLTIKEFSATRDSYEPNDSDNQAKPIELGQEIQANFSHEQDQDWFEFTVDGNGLLEVQWVAAEIVKPEILIYDSDHKTVGYLDLWSWEPALENKNVEEPFRFKIAPGKYYLNVSNSWGTVVGDYQFSLQFRNFSFLDSEINDTHDKAASLNLGEIKQGTLYPDGDIDYYAIDIMDKGPVVVQIAPPTGIDTLVGVYKEPEAEERKSEGTQNEREDEFEEANLEYVAEINSGEAGKPDTGVFMAMRPGRYYLGVAGWPEYEGNAIVEPYTISVKKFIARPDLWESNNTFKTARAIGNKAVFSPTFMGTEDKDWFKIYVPAFSGLNIKLEVPNDIDGVVELYDSNVRLLMKADQALVGEEETLYWPVKKAGIYYIKSYDYLGNASILPYKLTVHYTKTKSNKAKKSNYR